MAANLENSAVATGLEKVSFHSNPKEGPAFWGPFRIRVHVPKATNSLHSVQGRNRFLVTESPGATVFATLTPYRLGILLDS